MLRTPIGHTSTTHLKPMSLTTLPLSASNDTCSPPVGWLDSASEPSIGWTFLGIVSRIWRGKRCEKMC